MLWRYLCVRKGKWSRRQLSHKFNEVLRRIQIIKRGGTFMHPVSEYLNLLRVRYSRLLRESSGTPALQPWDSRSESDPEVLRYLRVSQAVGIDRAGFRLSPHQMASSRPFHLTS
ncbi:hypothetical protein IscW_ISCW008393 [Ixodes scapularis]|uniref:Uncharacterized protein n=1 Tax=Ixodes scapularis TaxID=6945 RepID=B7PWB3_IXOSC|nr:hypothetical protein IscW_ISCW008393 [Ixodes scapularis]|eukprot:XP_002409655.1 hypothetical protein IscW_ISCW008393 [Ixodes scapularis]